jgi:hypothetical protein
MAFSGNNTNDSAAMAAYQAEKVDSDPAVSATPTGQCSKRLLAELLALNEEMILQLHLERVSVAGTTGFLAKMIAQHERAAALLRSQLARAGSGARR